VRIVAAIAAGLLLAAAPMLSAGKGGGGHSQSPRLLNGNVSAGSLITIGSPMISGVGAPIPVTALSKST